MTGDQLNELDRFTSIWDDSHRLLRRSLSPELMLRSIIQKSGVAARLVREGDVSLLWKTGFATLYKKWYEAVYAARSSGLRARAGGLAQATLRVVTDHPIAYESPDHSTPFGTTRDNSTNKKFVLHMDRLIRQELGTDHPAMADLGCSGGQLVKDFLDLGWTAVGLEGSDYSLKRGRANWAELGRKNLFTCDITKRYSILRDDVPLQFDLVTAWEVLEHVATPDLAALFAGVQSLLKPLGLFIASTNSGPSVVDGVELHQTRMTNVEWKSFIAQHFPGLEPADVGLRTHQYVRYDFREPSFLIYRKRA